MTKQSEIVSDSNYIPLLDHGFVGLVGAFGDDAAIVQAARVSYGSGTKSVREDRGLIRYLMRHAHTSPFEQCEVKLHIKLPIFIMRQLNRHRTANLNEYSGRYSIMSDEFYVPDLAHIEAQSSDNKQGRGGAIDDTSKSGVQWIMSAVHHHAYEAYKTLLADREADFCDAFAEDDPLLSEEFPGIAREIARCVLPVSNYTETYFKMDLLNLFKMLKLRADAHAQYEIRVYADAIYQLIQPIFPAACEAFEDYLQKAVNMSRMDMDVLRKYIDLDRLKQDVGAEGELPFGKNFGMSKREVTDLLERLSA